MLLRQPISCLLLNHMPICTSHEYVMPRMAHHRCQRILFSLISNILLVSIQTRTRTALFSLSVIIIPITDKYLFVCLHSHKCHRHSISSLILQHFNNCSDCYCAQNIYYDIRNRCSAKTIRSAVSSSYNRHGR